MDLSLLGSRIKSERRRSNLTLEQFSEMVGISRNYLWELEDGRKAPALGTLCALALALNISVDYLLGMTEERRTLTAPPSPSWRSKSVERIAAAINDFDDNDLLFISDFVSAFQKYTQQRS